jgi:hypothetical protein
LCVYIAETQHTTEEYQGAAVTRDITKQTDQKTGPDDKPQGLV